MVTDLLVGRVKAAVDNLATKNGNRLDATPGWGVLGNKRCGSRKMVVKSVDYSEPRTFTRTTPSRCARTPARGSSLPHLMRQRPLPLATERSGSCIIDGEAVACDDGGMPSFNRIRYRRHDASVFLYAFDLIELNGDDLRRDPFQVRKATLASVLAKAGPGLRFHCPDYRRRRG
jgi:hypothetical protein